MMCVFLPNTGQHRLGEKKNMVLFCFNLRTNLECAKDRQN